MMAAINDIGFECLLHPAYSPDLDSSDYWLFGEMKRPSREDILRFQTPLGLKSYQGMETMYKVKGGMDQNV